MEHGGRLTQFCDPFGSNNSLRRTAFLAYRARTEWAGRHLMTAALRTAAQLPWRVEQEGGQVLQVGCRAQNWYVDPGATACFSTSEERVQLMEQLKPTYTTRRAQKAQQLQDLKISDRWKLLVCLVVTAAARNPLPLQLALRSVYRGSSHCPGDRKNRALKGGRLEATNRALALNGPIRKTLDP